MYGFENIATHNGWAMAAAGAVIVLCGLAVLSFVISQLHKLLNFLENRKRKHRQRRDGYKSGKT
ncbi:MAG: OadG family protein [Deltaproteobacteria bacterium]|nr:MAG: OadG family protein [Deltaproteobacteria bacterium]